MVGVAGIRDLREWFVMLTLQAGVAGWTSSNGNLGESFTVVKLHSGALLWVYGCKAVVCNGDNE